MSADEFSSLVSEVVKREIASLSLPKETLGIKNQENPVNSDRACEITGYAKPTLYKKCKEDKDFPFHRMGKRLMFFESELIQWVRKRKNPSQDD